MNMSEYQMLAARTIRKDQNSDQKLVNAALGLSGEAGEVADLLKKYLFQGHAMDRDRILEEVGDVLWYCALACTALDEDLSAVAEANIDKLRQRYPNGFSEYRSTHRDK